ncbi:dynamin family protein [Profundibacter sp.]|uniref:dynamin family protein n=1 Tax=Profundibacter sp. TaxID=3101071 RepID=UPI003D11185A
MNVPSRDEAIRSVTAREMDRLSRWASRKPVIALMGEFSSGKSTLLNMLVGQSILPTQVTATRLPPVWLRYGDKSPFWVDRNGDHHDVAIDDLSSVPVKEARYIRIYAISEQLEKCDLIDTPGISDPNIPTDSWINTIGYANSVLWCTHAGQAWRESERSQWEALPERLRENSLLLVTRADKIVSREDLDKINRRLQRETSDLFGSHCFISLTLALRARQGDDQNNLWVRSGGDAFMKSLDGIIAKINQKREKELERYRSTGGPVGTGRDNVSILRPTRIRPNDPERHKARLDAKDAANLRSSALGPVVEVEDETAVDREADDIPAEADKPMVLEKIDEVSSVEEVESPASDEPEAGAIEEPLEVEEDLQNIEDVNPEENSADNAEEQANAIVETGTPINELQETGDQHDEPEDHVDDTENQAKTDDHPEDQADNVEEDARLFLDQMSKMGDDLQSDDTILEPEADEEIQEKEAGAEDILNVVSKIAAVSDEGPEATVSDNVTVDKAEGEYERTQSPSEVWKEILASQDIETMPQVVSRKWWKLISGTSERVELCAGQAAWSRVASATG